METITKTLTDFFNTLVNGPAALIVFFAVIAAGYVIKCSKWPPNRFIPFITLCLSVAGMVALAGEKEDPVRLGFAGAAVWLVAWLTHNKLLRRLEKFLPDGVLTQDAGGKPGGPPAVVLLGVLIPLVVAGCATTPRQAVYKTAGAFATTVHGAMLAWGDYVASGRASLEEERKVKAAYERYQGTMRVLKAVMNAVEPAPGNQDQFDAVVQTVTRAGAELIELVNGLTAKPKERN